MLFIDEEEAIANGMTHEGVLHGVRVWYKEDPEDEDFFYAVPFFSLAIAWLYLIDVLLELACFVTGTSATIEPRMVRKLEKQSLT